MRISPTRLTHPKPRKTRKLLRPLRVRCGIAGTEYGTLLLFSLSVTLLHAMPRQARLDARTGPVVMQIVGGPRLIALICIAVFIRP